MKFFSSELPKKVSEVNNKFEVVYAVKQTETDGITTYESEKIIVDRIDYGQIVSAIIHEKSSVDDEIALRNNYTSSPKDAEWVEYQDYREFAKSVAREIVG